MSFVCKDKKWPKNKSFDFFFFKFFLVLMNFIKKYIHFFYFVLIQLYLLFQLFFSIEINEKKNQNSSQEIHITLGKGILQKYFLELEIYQNTYSELIENEHKPQRLFQNLNMDIKKNLIVIFLYLFLFFLIILLMFVMYYRISFYSIFKKQIYFLFLILLLFDVFFIKRNKLLEIYLITQSYWSFLYVYIESMLIFLTTFFLIFEEKPKTTRPFLDLYYKKGYEIKNKLKNFIIFFKDLIIIALVSTLIVNVFLFPIFYFQIQWKLPFGYLFFSFLLILSLYYVYSYYNISKTKEENPNLIISLAFLNYRIISHFLYFVLIFLFFLIVVFVIFSIIFLDLNFLESYQFLEPRHF